MTIVLALLAPALHLAAPAAAQDAATDPRCASVRPAYPAGFGGWSTRTASSAGATPRTAPVLPVGRAADLSLRPLAEVQPVAPWGKTPVDGHAGVAMFQVTRAGTYRVGLGSAAWVDVVRAGKPLASSAHGHGPACTGIRKIVDFRLQRGRYILQLSGSAAATVPVLIAQAPVTRGAA
ncbi:hypothetical protein ASG29_11500 [Sphingomonas sp. Leaf412]|uniref:hypothetical protein n=1 Tax=Sphingomonas sp. Leaf412 TaxID=1736370 RepID=UPI0006F9568D|nr:hypothetical protein [Sphingomonas sp. Leaf412]KQT32406.1 hypothetical protein ASG29_11500 [Sphingomonas sp. Leaf412]